MSVHAAGNGVPVFYDGHCRPFLRLRDGTHPLAARIREPRPLAQDGQIRPASPVGAKEPGPRPADRFAGQPAGVSRFAGQAGTQARPYARTTANQRKQGRTTTHILPADYAQRRLAVTPQPAALRAPSYALSLWPIAGIAREQPGRQDRIEGEPRVCWPAVEPLLSGRSCLARPRGTRIGHERASAAALRARLPPRRPASEAPAGPGQPGLLVLLGCSDCLHGISGQAAAVGEVAWLLAQGNGMADLSGAGLEPTAH